MKPNAKKPTNAEVAILRVLWSRGPSTVREVAQAMGREAAYTTVLKLMQNMTDKRLVHRDESSRTHVYAAGATPRNRRSGNWSPTCSTRSSMARQRS